MAKRATTENKVSEGMAKAGENHAPKTGIQHDIERITDMEQRFNRVDEALRALEIAMDTIISLENDILELDAYYSGDEWKADFRSDELGLLPQDLKRGVLSEDAIWDLLGRVDGIKHRMIDFVTTDLG